MAFLFLKILFCVWTVIACCNAHPTDEERKGSTIGNGITLQGDEVLANECLMDAKIKETKKVAYRLADTYDSEVFDMLQKMPKGGLLHAHTLSIGSMDYVVFNITFEPNAYMCFVNGTARFRFFDKPNEECEWHLIEKVRKTGKLNFARLLNYLYPAEPGRNQGVDERAKLDDILDSIEGLIMYRPVFEKYLYNAISELYEDNVMFVELRSSFTPLYDLDGTHYDAINVAKMYEEVAERFSKDHPDFLGLRVIYSPNKKLSEKIFDDHVNIYKRVKSAYPNLIIGFDFEGREDKGDIFRNYVDKLQTLNKEATFFFHGGEINWYGHSTDENLRVAVLLKVKRIGDGLALLKHPELMEDVKAKKIAIELNPITDEMTKLEDLQSHPMSYFFTNDYPVVVSSDNPRLWGSYTLTYDFYATFLGLLSRDADLRALKQLAINSIVYSGFDDKEKSRAFEVFDKAWIK